MVEVLDLISSLEMKANASSELAPSFTPLMHIL